jgi:hypothetical protein
MPISYTKVLEDSFAYSAYATICKVAILRTRASENAWFVKLIFCWELSILRYTYSVCDRSNIYYILYASFLDNSLELR